MRLFKYEHRDLVNITREFGYKPEELLFRKKGGWVKVDLEGISDFFEFHRKKVTRLLENQFKDHYQYRAKILGGIVNLESWAQVKMEFREWLSSHQT